LGKIESAVTAEEEIMGSASVLKVNGPLTDDPEPIVQPTSVTVTAVLAASGLPVAANTMEVSPGCAGVSVAPPVDTLAVGVAEVAKKPDG
jgi:hypothetical protein